jgi:hypothetical protein
MDRMLGWLRTEYPDRSAEIDRSSSAIVAADPQTMGLFLQRLRDDYGSVAGYLGSIGLSHVPGRLQDLLLEP